MKDSYLIDWGDRIKYFNNYKFIKYGKVLKNLINQIIIEDERGLIERINIENIIEVDWS